MPLYSYLTSMPMISLTSDRLAKLKAEHDAAVKERNAIRKKKIADIWIAELDDLKAFLDEMYSGRESVKK